MSLQGSSSFPQGFCLRLGPLGQIRLTVRLTQHHAHWRAHCADPEGEVFVSASQGGLLPDNAWAHWEILPAVVVVLEFPGGSSEWGNDASPPPSKKVKVAGYGEPSSPAVSVPLETSLRL